MAQYRVSVQVVTWYDIIVAADFPEQAITKAEALRPRQIIKRGTRKATETGLAKPDSVTLVNPD
jgi:hypothetical protein